LTSQEDDVDSDSLPLSSLDASIASTLNSLCLEYRRLGSEIDQREITRKDLKEEIEKLVLTLPSKRISAPGWKTVKSQKVTHPLDKRLLVSECNKRDMDPITVIELIKSASPAKRGKEYVSILAPGKEDEKESNVFD
jgi:hypothetical protein